MNCIYLDYNTTTPLAPSVREAMEPFWSQHYLLPGQHHSSGLAVAESLEQARQGLAALVGCDAFELVFTGSGTEANNLAVLGTAAVHSPGHMVVSAIEHEAVWNAARSLARQGWQIDVAACDPQGVVSPEAVDRLLRPNTRLVCLQAANPILGTLQPVREVADLCHVRGIPVHCDAAQLLGKLPVDAAQMRVDTLAVSGHKFYGPKGTGALFVRRGLALSPITFGETREMGLRPGAENVPGWVGLGAAAQLAARCVSEAADTLAELRDRFVNQLQALVDPPPQILCTTAPRLPNTALIEMTGNATRVQRAAARLVFLTARSSTPADEMTRCLRAIGRTESEIGRTLRISVGWTTSRDQVDRAAELLAEASERVSA